MSDPPRPARPGGLGPGGAHPARNEPIIRAQGLRKRYPGPRSGLRRSRRQVHAVDGIDLEIPRGGRLALVGESGCGKTTTGRMLVGLTKPSGGSVLAGPAVSGGTEVDVSTLSGRALRQFRRRVQMIFQDPYESMNPRRTVSESVGEALLVHRLGTMREREDRVSELLELVGLSPPEAFLLRYPHELSGGQRQRVAIARALILEPAFVVADEPTSMLDVSLRLSVMELMLRLADRLGVSYLYITHDLAVARYMADRIAVMYLGKIVELADTEELLHNPLHPYTRALLAAVPVPDPGRRRREVQIRGGVTQPVEPPPLCRFLDRCPWADEYCRDHDHPASEDAGGGHLVACYHPGKGDVPA